MICYILSNLTNPLPLRFGFLCGRLEDTKVSINGDLPTPVLFDSETGLHRIPLDAGTNSVAYTLPANIRIEPRANDTVSIYHSALLYAVPVAENIRSNHSAYPGAPPGVQEYTMTPSTKWALAIDPSTLRFNNALPGTNSETLPNPIWTLTAPPVSITATVCEIAWELIDGYAPNPPSSGKRTVYWWSVRHRAGTVRECEAAHGRAAHH